MHMAGVVFLVGNETLLPFGGEADARNTFTECLTHRCETVMGVIKSRRRHDRFTEKLMTFSMNFAARSEASTYAEASLLQPNIARDLPNL
jgi:hypothetical protein